MLDQIQDQELADKLCKAFSDWLESSRPVIGDKWYTQMQKIVKHAQADKCNSVTNAMLMFNMVSNLGVSAGVTLHGYQLVSLANGLDRKLTCEFLSLVSQTLKLQMEPKFCPKHQQVFWVIECPMCVKEKSR